jgi:hypothetical protein
MPFNDPLADRQADARSFVLRAAVEPLKNQEYPFEVLRLNAYAVIDYAYLPSPPLARGAHGYFGFAGTMEFNGVADEVLQQLRHLRRVGID